MTLVIAHRGASKDHEENTLEAFTGAERQGAHWVEFDVRRTADGELVVHHDASTPGGQIISECTAEALPDSMPTLAETLLTCREMGVNVEIKNSPAEAGYDPSPGLVSEVATAIGQSGHAGGLLVTCFDIDTLDTFKRIAPDVDTGYLVLSAESPVDALTVARARGHVAVNPHVDTVDRALIERAHDQGIEINAWTTDDAARIRELASWGIDGIITNVPALALAALAT